MRKEKGRKEVANEKLQRKKNRKSERDGVE